MFVRVLHPLMDLRAGHNFFRLQNLPHFKGSRKAPDRMTVVADKVDPVGSLAQIPVTDLRHLKLTVVTRREGRSLSQLRSPSPSRKICQILLRPKRQGVR